MNKIKFTKTKNTSYIPKRATEGSAGLDLCACIEDPLTINPGEIVTVPTGIAISLESNEYAAMVFARSGLGVKHGITLSNGVGVIDSDYRGEIFVGLCNISKKSYTINPNDRIAQLIIMPVVVSEFIEVNSLDQTKRGSSGFGSTGK